MTSGRKVLVVVPNEELRRSIEFTVEAEGYAVDSHQELATVIADGSSHGFDCAVIDEDAVDAAQRNLVEFARLAGSERPVVVLADRLAVLVSSLPFRLLRKPLLGAALVEAILPAVVPDDAA